MEFRNLGRSGLKVPVLSLGTATFGGGSEIFRAIGESNVAEATRLVDICLDAGVNMFDTADIYHEGISEEILGQAIAGRRDKVLDLHQSYVQDGSRSQRSRLVPLSFDSRLRSQPAPTENRLH